jgi:hypothetical protein
MYLGFLAMYRGWKSIKPYDSVDPFTDYPPKCTCWCQSRVRGPLHLSDAERTTLAEIGKTLLLDSGVVECEDGVY